eukprot:12149991-Ditylum_brightwellii.AAC.1
MSAQPAESSHIKDPEGVEDMVGQIAGDRYKTILEANAKSTKCIKKMIIISYFKSESTSKK